MKSLERLDQWIAGKVKRLSSNVARSPQGQELLEIRRDILEDIRNHIEPKGGGKWTFPYNEIEIHVPAQDDAHKELLQATLAGDDGLEDDIEALLGEAGCAMPRNLSVMLDLEAPQFGVSYRRRKPPSVVPTVAARPAAKLIVTKGAADPSEYAIASDRVNIGRLKEVIGEKEGLRRRNDVAFDATETTVSREHAYIRYEPNTGKFRVCDDHSARGVSIFREGRRIGVPKASTRGAQLQTGDELQIGDVRIRFEIVES